MTTLYTLAYPILGDNDSQFIEAFRQAHDVRQRDVVAAHFTMAFGCSELSAPTYLRHVEEVSRRARTFSFTCRYAMLGADDEDDTAYVFLVPDEGYSELSLLHDGLYTGPLEPYLRLDVPYIPHITIGTSQDRRAVKCLCDELNRATLGIQGRVDGLTVAELREGKIYDRMTFPLGG